MNDLKTWVIDEMINELKGRVGQEVYGYDLGTCLFESENINGVYFDCTHQARQWIKKHFDDLPEVIEHLKSNYGEEFTNPLDVFNEPDKFQITVMVELSEYYCGQCPTICKHWDDCIKLTDDTIDRICEELEFQKRGFDVYD